MGKSNSMVDSTGKVYTDRKEYVNAPAEYIDSDLICSWLWNGEREPQNDYERKLLEELEDMKRRGVGLELPFD